MGERGGVICSKGPLWSASKPGSTAYMVCALNHSPALCHLLGKLFDKVSSQLL